MNDIVLHFFVSYNNMNQNDTITIEVTFPDGSLQNIELAIYKETEDSDVYLFITLYDNKIYKSILKWHEDILTNITDSLFNSKHKHKCNNDFTKFQLQYSIYVEDQPVSFKFCLHYDPDEDDVIGTYIRENELFGKSNKCILK